MQHFISAMRYRMLAAALSLWFFSANAALAAPTASESTPLAARDVADDTDGSGGMKSHIIIPLVVIPVLAVLTVASFALYIWRRAAANKARRQSTVKLNARPQSTANAHADAGRDSRPDSLAFGLDSKRHSRRQSDAVLAVDLSKAFGRETPAQKKTRESSAPAQASMLKPQPEH